MRDTSLTAYDEIQNNGLLSKRRFEVYSLIHQYGPISANDLVRKVRQLQGTQANQTGYNARFSELEKLGVIERVGTISDQVSSKQCGLYVVTNKLPIKLEKEESYKAKVARLEDRIRTLEKMVVGI